MRSKGQKRSNNSPHSHSRTKSIGSPKQQKKSPETKKVAEPSPLILNEEPTMVLEEDEDDEFDLDSAFDEVLDNSKPVPSGNGPRSLFDDNGTA